jgi:NAD(P)H-dependent FMN reductase
LTSSIAWLLNWRVNIIKLIVIIASTRPGRLGDQIGKWTADYAAANTDFEVSIADLAEINLPMFDEPGIPSMGVYEHEHTKKWSKIVEEADAIVIVTPEYNFTMPASLLNAVSYLHHEWKRKPVGYVGYGFGGAVRAIQTEKLLLAGLSAASVAPSVNLINTHALAVKTFAPEERYEQTLAAMLTELHIWAAALAPTRHKVA